MLIDKLKRMWAAFLKGIKLANSELKGESADPDIQKYQDIDTSNFVAMAISKLCNLTCADTAFKINSDSRLIEPLKVLTDNLQDNRHNIFNGMAGDGEYYVFPALDSKGNLYHSYLDRAFVRITDISNNIIKCAYAVLDYYQPNNTTTYFLQRHHRLDNNGNLTISYKAVNDQGIQVITDRWCDLTDREIILQRANHIGFGRYKSPVSSRGRSKIYGVPLNFGCGAIEKEIRETLSQINKEFVNGRSVIFTDPRNLMKNEDSKEYKIAENVIPIRHAAGDAGKNIDIFSPELRFSPHYDKLMEEFERYERQMGLSKGIFTNNEALLTATATAIKRGNSDTLALIKNFQDSIDEGNKMTLEADSIFLGIRPDLWTYDSEWHDPFEDKTEEFERLIRGVSIGAVSLERLTRFIYPTLTDEQIAMELKKVQAEQSRSADAAIEAALRN